MLLLIGGFLCGLLAGAAARYGRLCSMGAVEDAVVANDWRAARAWLLAIAVAVATTEVASSYGAFDLRESVYATQRLDWVGTLLGGLMFGFGMALAGTCSFGLLVRAGTGDLRAVVTAAVVGISAFAATAGMLAPLRSALLGIAAIDLGGPHSALLGQLATTKWGPRAADVLTTVSVVLLAVVALTNRALLKRRRLIVAAVGMGLAVTMGWIITGRVIANLEEARLESLSFVAPTGRLMLELMGQSTQYGTFGAASVLGVIVGSLAVSFAKDEIRWEAFDDPREMRRHLLGALLMGVGGVLARGCTVGQGLTAASALSLSAPIAFLGIVIGARAGLMLLLEGRSIWRVR